MRSRMLRSARSAAGGWFGPVVATRVATAGLTPGARSSLVKLESLATTGASATSRGHVEPGALPDIRGTALQDARVGVERRLATEMRVQHARSGWDAPGTHQVDQRCHRL